MSSYFLAKCAQEIAYTDLEDMLVCSGTKLGNVIFIDTFHRPKLEQTRIYVRQKPGEIVAISKELEPFGANIFAIFHSHPGMGIPFPSANDHNYQSILEALGYRSIAGIFSQGGYIRFFTEKLDFHLLIIGNGVEKLDEDLYKLRVVAPGGKNAEG